MKLISQKKIINSIFFCQTMNFLLHQKQNIEKLKGNWKKIIPHPYWSLHFGFAILALTKG